MNKTLSRFFLSCTAAVSLLCASSFAHAQPPLAIADVHVHYSHDSVDMTPPARVIELMRQAGLKFALVSSSDDKGTQLLLEQAPDLIVPGLRPYRRRGETRSWIDDPAVIDYVEGLLAKGSYATLGEFHLYGDDALLEIPQKIVRLAEKHNLILHAHSDAEAVERLLASSDSVRVIWAHGGFDEPAEIADMLRRHDRLWADLAFRSEVGSGGILGDEWRGLFDEFPTRLMLGTDTYTPERIFYITEHAMGARTWLEDLPAELAQGIAWRNAYELLMPVWERNRKQLSEALPCAVSQAGREWLLEGDDLSALISTSKPVAVGQAYDVSIRLCGATLATLESIDADMPAHGHGMNYQPELVANNSNHYQAKGLLFHMPGEWQWTLKVRSGGKLQTLRAVTAVQ